MQYAAIFRGCKKLDEKKKSLYDCDNEYVKSSSLFISTCNFQIELKANQIM